MITLDKVRNYNDLLQIKVLNEDNLKINLSQQDQLKYGFVTLEYNIELLLKMNNIEKSIVVREDNKVVGYAIVTNKTVYGLNKLFDDLIDRVKTLTYCHNNLSNVEYALVGQLCIKKNYRGKGLVKKIYEFYKQEYSKKYKYLITDIDERNKRSLSAHLKSGFQIIDNFYWGESYWNIILWDWNNQNIESYSS